MEKVSRFGLIMGTALLLFFLLAIIKLSHKVPRLGLLDGKLLPCPSSPNCVNSEYNPAAALQLRNFPTDLAWQMLKNIISAQGGKVLEQNAFYLRAEFHSKWLDFIDDLEARLDTENGLIHLRSASRVGYYDFSVNRNRVNMIKARMNIYLDSQPDEDTLAK